MGIGLYISVWHQLHRLQKWADKIYETYCFMVQKIPSKGESHHESVIFFPSKGESHLESVIFVVL